MSYFVRVFAAAMMGADNERGRAPALTGPDRDQHRMEALMHPDRSTLPAHVTP